ncbi:MAG: potassium-transporting ATPase subunit KdpA [Bryobacterales bacterium]|nr:potassium-transporting ATPase subunit KdpA [Bryobacterales bacterium]
MTGADGLQIVLFLGVLLAAVKPLGGYMATVLEGKPHPLRQWLKAVEDGLYWASGIRPEQSMPWRVYAGALLAFNLMGAIAVYGLLRWQAALPWNPQGLGNVEPHTAWNIAISFATNTNWQNYGGETTLGYFVQMAGLTVQNFLSAATGMAVLAALARGIAGRSTEGIGNFWADIVRSTLYVLLPLSLGLAIALVSQGVIQNLDAYQQTAHGQVLPMGPAASQVAIKQLGTNGGGFFNVNSAHPFENPTPLTNFLEMLAIVLIPAALCYTFGKMVGDTRQGWALLAAMMVLFLPLLAVALGSEYGGGGNWEGKEVRFGIANSVLWAVATTAASNGSVNAMHDSFTALGGLIPMFLMQMGEVVFGGVGSGLYGMAIFAILAVFLAGLMVGRTPEYLGKKIEAFDMKMVSVAVLAPPFCVLLGTAVAVTAPMGLSGLQDRGPHGFSEILYAFSSMGNNNGSAFAGYGANNVLVNTAGGLAMFLARYWVAVPVLALAGSLAGKKRLPAGAGTLPTHGALFVALLAAVVLVVGALAFLPALALGPVVEHLRS